MKEEKRMKRLLGLLMAVMVVLFSTTAFADNYWQTAAMSAWMCCSRRK